MIQLLCVFVGGGLGSIARWYLSQLNQSETFDWRMTIGTFIANLLACIVLGFVWSQHKAAVIQPNVYILIGVGFCGGFSTFSTFSNELLQYWTKGAVGMGLIYAISSFVIGMLGVLGGSYLAQRFFGMK